MTCFGLPDVFLLEATEIYLYNYLENYKIEMHSCYFGNLIIYLQKSLDNIDISKIRLNQLFNLVRKSHHPLFLFLS